MTASNPSNDASVSTSSNAPPKSTETIPGNTEHLTALAFEARTLTFDQLRRRTPGEAVAGDGGLEFSNDHTVGPLEWNMRLDRALGYMTGRELARYLDRHWVVVLTDALRADLEVVLRLAEQEADFEAEQKAIDSIYRLLAPSPAKGNL